jgi:hypothetical protein
MRLRLTSGVPAHPLSSELPLWIHLSAPSASWQFGLQDSRRKEGAVRQRGTEQFRCTVFIPLMAVRTTLCLTSLPRSVRVLFSRYAISCTTKREESHDASGCVVIIAAALKTFARQVSHSLQRTDAPSDRSRVEILASQWHSAAPARLVHFGRFLGSSRSSVGGHTCRWKLPNYFWWRNAIVA